MKRVAGDHIVVAGAARSGLAVARLLRFKGARVFLTEYGKMDAVLVDQLQQDDIDVEHGGHSELALAGDYLVVSPGVPSQSELVQHYLLQGKKVYSEIEVASWFNFGNTIAVTGTNGKTTVCSWLDHLWGIAERNYIVGGNIGQAYSSLLMNRAEDVEALLEVSSFQLDHIDTFKPRISMILNIKPDHLDRYDQKFESYAAAKFRIFENQDPQDHYIYSYDDVLLREKAEAFDPSLAPKKWAFSTKGDHGLFGAFIEDQEVKFRDSNGVITLISVNEIGLKGQHNQANALAVCIASQLSAIPITSLKKSLKTFKGVAHRMELVSTIHGVKYFNDSKATNVDAVWYALSAFHEPVILILGGRDKGNNYRDLFTQLQNKVHTIIAIGESRDKIAHDLEFMVPTICKLERMQEAVVKAAEIAKSGEVVLMSPACASFDQYSNYEERGEDFRKCVLDVQTKAMMEGKV